MILDKIESLLAEVKEMKASNAEEIEALRLKYLSKKGEINAVMADFRNVPADQKKEVGMKINELKQTALERLNALRDAIETSEDGDQGLDLTRTAYPIKLGTRHPLTIVKNEIIDIFSRMGFVLADGPEAEDDLHVFTKMNFAADHPARDNRYAAPSQKERYSLLPRRRMHTHIQKCLNYVQRLCGSPHSPI